MPFAVLSGSKIIGKVKTKSKKSLNSVLAKEFRKKNRVSLLKIRSKRKK